MPSAAQSWHRALLPSQQLGKSTVTVLAATAPNLPACQTHTDPLNRAAQRCPPKCHSHPTAAVVGLRPEPMLRPQVALGCFTCAFPRGKNSGETTNVCPHLQLHGWMSQHRAMLQDIGLSPCWSRQRLPCTGLSQTSCRVLGSTEPRADISQHDLKLYQPHGSILTPFQGASIPHPAPGLPLSCQAPASIHSPPLPPHSRPRLTSTTGSQHHCCLTTGQSLKPRSPQAEQRELPGQPLLLIGANCCVCSCWLGRCHC